MAANAKRKVRAQVDEDNRVVAIRPTVTYTTKRPRIVQTGDIVTRLHHSVAEITWPDIAGNNGMSISIERFDGPAAVRGKVQEVLRTCK